MTDQLYDRLAGELEQRLHERYPGIVWHVSRASERARAAARSATPYDVTRVAIMGQVHGAHRPAQCSRPDLFCLDAADDGVIDGIAREVEQHLHS